MVNFKDVEEPDISQFIAGKRTFHGYQDVLLQLTIKLNFIQVTFYIV